MSERTENIFLTIALQNRARPWIGLEPSLVADRVHVGDTVKRKNATTSDEYPDRGKEFNPKPADSTGIAPPHFESARAARHTPGKKLPSQRKREK